MAALIMEVLKDAMICILIAVAIDRIRHVEEWYYYLIFVAILFII